MFRKLALVLPCSPLVACGGAAAGADSEVGETSTGTDASSSTATTGASSTSTTTSTGSSSSGSDGSGDGGEPGCLADALLAPLGLDHMMVGAAMSDETAASTPFDFRYLYLAGGLFDGPQACDSCATDCTAGGGTSCSNAVGCAWWGCWQYDQDPPGAYVRGFAERARTDGQIPMITYYEELQGSGLGEGTGQLAALADPEFLGRYLADFRFLLDQLAGGPALLHVEPDLWGYGQHENPDPHAIAAAVSTANPEDCGDQEDSFAGFGRCLIAMARRHAPEVRIGLHGSGWGTGFDVLANADPGFDVVGQAQALADFLVECGAAEADFVVVDALDRDAGFYESQGQDRWWDETNATLPNFDQAFSWSKALAERVGRPIVWWQLPVGNASLPDGPDVWPDNRVDYFMGHTEQVVAAHGAAIAFGAGAEGQTTPETDGGNLVAKVRAYASGGGQTPCP